MTLSAVAALAIAASALTIPDPGRGVTSALGPATLDGGTTPPGGAEIRANRSAPRTSVVDLAEGSPSDRMIAAGDGRGPRASGTQSTPAFVEAQPRSSTVIRVSWGGVPRATGYDVERWSDATATWLTVATTRNHVTAYTDEGLDPMETYYYRVLVLLEDGVAAFPSDVVSATTLVDPPGPAVLRVTSNTRTSIDLGWDDLVGESSYRIERSTDGATEWTAIGTTGQDVTTYTDDGLEPDSTYFYRVIATNEGGSSPPSNVVSQITSVSDTGGVIEDDDGDGDGSGADTDATAPVEEPAILAASAGAIDEADASEVSAG